MDAQQWVAAIAALLIGAGGAWAGAHWWFGRRLKELAVAKERLEAARHLASQQAAQARKQIEMLQQEMAEMRLAAQRRSQRAEAQAQASAPAPLPIFGATGPGELPSDGFPQTQILPRKR